MGSATKKAHRKHDYIDLFPGAVFPTGEIDVLERGGNLLFIKTYEHGREIVDAHRKIWTLLARISNVEEAPGNITVVCVWGLGLNVPREWVVFDYQGESPRQIGSVDQWRSFLRGWWNSAKRGR